MHIELVDDGTLDTVFAYRGRQYRFDTEYVNDHGGVDDIFKRITLEHTVQRNV